ncbi:probable cysteine--tRNA ligase, mitochondrial isoform X2 [Manis pentadactyla]|uniref:probable cysteine--tRNA ligase, mitochondrial isoform X2 n=1 Tax=Manis pentadactyla TaxID=143292 RepID=UPI00187585B1|nr:probable cysteine--tRNA ligase, mitochondrial isoform X2 [Manis pentadactyla]
MLRTRVPRGSARVLRAALGLGSGPRPRRQRWLQPAGYDTGVKVYNSLTRRKDPLIVGSADGASWYSCGPTVYDHAHLGHACSYVRFDIIRRILTRVFGCSVVMVMGITDVDDKIIKRAGEMNISPASLANLYEEDFKQDMAALKVLPPTVYLRVTENIPQIISFIQGIIANGHAYPTARGNVYFDLQSRGDDYGRLVSVVPGPAAEAGDSDKRHASDFALWKAAKPRELFWTSPWGDGRPGWHVECSAIASSVFGRCLDIHSGGIDLAFPHHENEIAQCEAFHQCQQWGNYFLHSGHLHVKGKEEKMSKSLKNYITIKDFLKTCSPDVFRLFCMRSSYRSAIDYSDGTLLEAKHLLLAVAAFAEDARAYMKGQLVCRPIGEAALWERLSHTRGAVQAALADDFDTARAVDAVMGLIHHGNRQLKAATQEPSGPRSPAVFGSVMSYIEQFFETVGIGISLADTQKGLCPALTPGPPCPPSHASVTEVHLSVPCAASSPVLPCAFSAPSWESAASPRGRAALSREPYPGTLLWALGGQSWEGTQAPCLFLCGLCRLKPRGTTNTPTSGSSTFPGTLSLFQGTVAQPLCTVWWRSWFGSGSRSGSLPWPRERPPGRPSSSSSWRGSPCWRHVMSCVRTLLLMASALRTGAARPPGP